MAEYQMTPEELIEFIDQSIDAVQNKDDRDKMKEYRPEIMCVLTGDFSDNGEKEIQNQLKLWNSRLSDPAQIIIGNRVIRLKDCILAIVGVAIETGALTMITGSTSINITSGAILATGVAWSLYKWLQSVSALDARDYCVYLQLVKHTTSRDCVFSENEIIGWFVECERRCMIDTKDWKCYYQEIDGACSFVRKEGIKESITSLVEKKMVKYADDLGESKMYSLRSFFEV